MENRLRRGGRLLYLFCAAQHPVIDSRDDVQWERGG